MPFQDEVDKILEETDSMLWAVINNAATLVFADAAFQTSQLVRNQIDVNLFGVWLVSKTFLPHLMASQGRLVNIVSFCTECPLPTLSLYTATKAGVKSLSEGMRMELKRFGVDVILFNPGDHPRETPLCAGQKENYEVGIGFLAFPFYITKMDNAKCFIEIFLCCEKHVGKLYTIYYLFMTILKS